MRLRVLWFGRAGPNNFEDEVSGYRQKVSRRWQAEDMRLRPVSSGRSDDPSRALAKEAEALQRHTPAGWWVIALTEKGKPPSSEAFARSLVRDEEDGAPGLALVIGSDIGLHPDVISGARRVLSLSPMTFSHQLARLLIWEQLFRATHILGGGGYHRPGIQ
ncbi:MAG: 23S rRNA (pseudouridine(1915)-N(3))-methyltransferase RlmH [bacterium]|nr:23S rRNA (pseudouridine(1915)-N(3))-methyltransferase RlmH [bacterium]